MTLTQLPLRVQLRDRSTFDSYYAGPNREAVTALRDLVLARAPGIYLFGAGGTGKTHLLQAAVHAASSAAQTGVFLGREALEDGGAAMLDGVEEARLLAIDSPARVLRSRDFCVALLRCIDARRSQQLPTIFAATEPPERLDCALPDLRTRLTVLAVYGLRDLDDIHRNNLLDHRLRERGLEPAPPLLGFLLARLPRDTASLLVAVDRLDAACLSAKRRRLSIPFAQQVLHDLLPPPISRTPGSRRTPSAPPR